MTNSGELENNRKRGREDDEDSGRPEGKRRKRRLRKSPTPLVNRKSTYLDLPHLSLEGGEKIEKVGLVRLSVTKLARISDPETKLCRAVLINNTLRTLQTSMVNMMDIGREPYQEKMDCLSRPPFEINNTSKSEENNDMVVDTIPTTPHSHQDRKIEIKYRTEHHGNNNVEKSDEAQNKHTQHLEINHISEHQHNSDMEMSGTMLQPQHQLGIIIKTLTEKYQGIDSDTTRDQPTLGVSSSPQPSCVLRTLPLHSSTLADMEDNVVDTERKENFSEDNHVSNEVTDTSFYDDIINDFLGVIDCPKLGRDSNPNLLQDWREGEKENMSSRTSRYSYSSFLSDVYRVTMKKIKHRVHL